MGKELIECDLINPDKEWRLNINGNADKTGVGDCGLFVEAKNEKEALKYLKNLIKIIREGRLEEMEELIR